MNRLSVDKELKTDTLKNIDHEKFKIGIRPDGIIHLFLKDHITLEKENIIEIKNALTEISSGKKMFLLTIIGENSFSSKEAREYGAREENTRNTIANAILIDSLPKQLVANFFIQFNKPKIPIKLFNSEKKAVLWLKSMMYTN